MRDKGGWMEILGWQLCTGVEGDHPDWSNVTKDVMKAVSPRSLKPPHLVFKLRSEHCNEPISESYLYLAHLGHELKFEVVALPSLAWSFTPWNCSVVTYSWGPEIGNDTLRCRNAKQFSLPKHSSRHLVPDADYNPEKGSGLNNQKSDNDYFWWGRREMYLGTE